ncbi:MAG: putative metal-dependent hydrolase [Oleispira sp.]|jgi:predicted metal-dependent hydrolase
MSKVLSIQPSRDSSIPVRKMSFDFSNVPKDYLNGSLAKSHLFDGLNLLFPEGERFFMRAVRDGLHKIDNHDLKQQARGFFGQETQHAMEHEKFFDVLEKNGYIFRDKLNKLDRFILKMRDILPAGIRLSITAGAEHLTAVLGAMTLSDEDIEKSHPAMRDLIQWHAIEEIEHKAIAFDVYQASNGNYILRIIGYVIAMLFIHLTSSSMTKHFLLQDGYNKKEARTLLKEAQKKMLARHKSFGKNLMAYFKPRFHPNSIDESGLVGKAMSRLGIA